eukprot:121967-Prymnesium_polylepis.1
MAALRRRRLALWHERHDFGFEDDDRGGRLCVLDVRTPRLCLRVGPTLLLRLDDRRIGRRATRAMSEEPTAAGAAEQLLAVELCAVTLLADGANAVWNVALGRWRALQGQHGVALFCEGVEGDEQRRGEQRA